MPAPTTQKSDDIKGTADALRSLVRLLARLAAREFYETELVSGNDHIISLKPDKAG